MPGMKKKEVSDAIAALRADPKLTRYEAARRFNITPGALYNSRTCKKLFAERAKKGAKA
jgi:transposase-like protein